MFLFPSQSMNWAQIRYGEYFRSFSWKLCNTSPLHGTYTTYLFSPTTGPSQNVAGDITKHCHYYKLTIETAEGIVYMWLSVCDFLTFCMVMI